MESKRQKKYARLLQKELGEIFQQNANSVFDGAFITVTLLKASPDLRQAKVYLSFLLVPNKQAMLDKVRENTKFIRQILGSRLRNVVKYIPELAFFLDDTEDVRAEVESLFKGLDIPEEKPENGPDGDQDNLQD